jgi:predicted RNA-binding protein YlqC (UPF0109 family)
MIKELVEHIVQQLSQDKDQVRVVVNRGDEGKQTIEITVSDRDRGRLIGRKGQTVKALRLLIEQVAPEGKKLSISIVE